LPREIRSKEEFRKLLEEAVEVRVKKEGEAAKVKLRTPARLYTFKTTGGEVDALTKGVKVKVVEF
jgi:hypothetical protein